MTLVPSPSGKPREPKKPKSARPRRSRWPLKLGLAVVVVLGAAYVAGYFITGLRIPANTTVVGVDVSGMSPAAAQRKIDEAVAPRLDDPITLANGAEKILVKPADAGLAFDSAETVAKAGGARSWNPKMMWRLFFGEHAIDAELDVDEGKLRTAVTTLAESIDKPAVEPQITFAKAKPAARKPKDGRLVARKETAELLKKSFPLAAESTRIPTAVSEPTVGQEALDKALKEFAEPAMSGPVLLLSGGKRAELPTTAFAPALIVQVKDGKLMPSIDPKELAKPLQDSTTGLGTEARDASFRIENGAPVVIPSKSGLGLQPDELAKTLVPVLSKTGKDRRLKIEAKIVEPEFTTKQAKSLGVKEKVSEFSTQYDPAAYRDINQGRAAELLDGTLLKPGETFSFNDTVGERTVANGFTQGTVINGGVFREELGGGVSQVVTTTYNAAFFAGMTDVEHHPHDFYIARYPVGREATVYWGSLDLKFKNDTKYGVLIHATVQRSAPGRQGVMTVQLYSTKVWDITAGVSARRNFHKPGLRFDPTNRCVSQSPVQGFDIDVFRTFSQNGNKVKTETDTAHYRAADEVRCQAKPETKKKKKKDD